MSISTNRLTHSRQSKIFSCNDDPNAEATASIVSAQNSPQKWRAISSHQQRNQPQVILSPRSQSTRPPISNGQDKQRKYPTNYSGLLRRSPPTIPTLLLKNITENKIREENGKECTKKTVSCLVRLLSCIQISHQV